jgi:4-amino-4-deoxy-L-arabinose transferase-like glycosyltransferase
MTITSELPAIDVESSMRDLPSLASPPPEVPTERSAREGRWVRPAFIALLVMTAIAYLWDLNASGYANSFYAAAVQAGTKSWKAFFFGSIDSSNFITVDKPPASLWVMELSGRIFGFSSWSMLAPQALEGVAAVALLYAGVRRWFGSKAGLLAGALLALTPVAALMFRYNNPDSLLVLLLVASAYTLVRALEKAGTRWIVATGILVGFAFLAKMMQAFTVVPAFYLVYLIAAPTSLLHRIKQLFICTAAIALSAGWWVATVALWPAGSRPMIDGSPNNSILNLIFDYNGFGRLVSAGSGGNGAGFSGATGILRLFNDLMGGQASWLIPAALLALVAGLIWRSRAPRIDHTRAALILWGGWLVVTGLVFSFGQGVIHTYYTVALAPAIAALVAIGAVSMWNHRDHLHARLLGAVGIVGTAVWAYVLLDRSPDYFPWLRVVILIAGILSAVVLLVAPLITGWTRRLTGAAAGLAVIACLAGPLAFVGTTVTTGYTGSTPSAGASVTSSSAGGGFGGFGGANAPTGGLARTGNTATGEPSSPGHTGARPTGTRPTRTRPGGTSSSGGLPAGRTSGENGASTNLPTQGGGGIGGGGGMTTSTALTAALEKDAHSYRWVAATFGSQSAATLELSTGGDPVMAIGGFNGEGGNITLTQFKALVLQGDIHYFIASSGNGGGGPGGTTNSDSAITSWVKAHYTATTIGGETVYDFASSS